MSDIRYPEWQKEYQDALVEVNREKLTEKINLTEALIYHRLQQIAGDSDHHQERDAIREALSSLRIVKRDSLGYPDWNSSGG